MESEIISLKPKVITFRNKSLSQNSKNTYFNSIKEYYKFLKEHELEEGIDSVKKWLRTIDNYNTYNLRLQAIKEYLLKRFSAIWRTTIIIVPQNQPC